MISPAQITSQSFAPSGKGGYRASDVDTFLQRIYQSYTQLIAENQSLKDKLEYLEPQLDEYNKNKSSIAQALIMAQAAGEKSVEDAKLQAEKILSDKKQEAEAYYKKTTADAEAALEKAQKDFQALQEQSDIYKEKYLSDINAEADIIVNKANDLAADIVAKAYEDVEKAKEKADEVIKSAEEELISLQKETEKIRLSLLSVVSLSQQSVDKIKDVKLPENVFTKQEEPVEAPQLKKDDFEAFTFEKAKEAFSLPEKESYSQEEKEEPAEETVFETFQQSTEILKTDFVEIFPEKPENIFSLPGENDNTKVNSILNGIFSSVAEKKDGSLTFADILSHSQESNLISKNKPKDSD